MGNKIKGILNKYKSLPAGVRASFWFLICAFFQKGISFITTPIFTRLLSTAEYGQYSVFNSWFSILSVAMTLSLYRGVYTQGLVKFEESRKEYTSALEGLCTALTLFWLVVYLPFRSFWNELLSLTTIQMIAMLAMVWTTGIYNFWAVEQRVDVKYKKLVAVTIGVSIAKPVLGIIMVINSDDKVTARILGLVIVELVAYIGLYISHMIKGKKFFSKKIWTYALKFNLPLVPHYLSMSVLSTADRIMIKKQCGDSPAGIYNLAYNISMIMTMFKTALLQTLEPWLYKKIKKKEIKDIGAMAYPTFILIAIVNIILIAFAPEIIYLFAPKEYADAVWVIPPVVMSVYFAFAYNFFAVFEFYYEKTKYITVATLIGAVVNIILNYFGIELFGYYAAGYTTLLCYIIFAVFHYIFMQKICRDYLDGEYPYSTKKLLLISGVFMAVGFGFLALYNNIIVRYIVIAGLLVVAIIFRKKIINFVKQMIQIKKDKK